MTLIHTQTLKRALGVIAGVLTIAANTALAADDATPVRVSESGGPKDRKRT